MEIEQTQGSQEAALLDRNVKANKKGSSGAEAQRIKAFGAAIDKLRSEVEAKVGAEDVAYIQNVRKTSRGAEILGRGARSTSVEPVGFLAGVGALAAHKLLETIEIGHAALHGTYDRLPGAEAFHSKTFAWKVPIDEASWRHAHNVQHHQYTNVQGRDPDMNFAVLRLSPEVPYRRMHELQPVSNAFSLLGFTATINTHVTGLVDVYAAYPRAAETLPTSEFQDEAPGTQGGLRKVRSLLRAWDRATECWRVRSSPRSRWVTGSPRSSGIYTRVPPSTAGTWAPPTIPPAVTPPDGPSGTSCRWRARAT